MNISASRTPHPKKFDDRQMEEAMGRLLQAGVVLASVVVLAGGVLYVRAHLHTLSNYQVFSSEPTNLRSFRGVFAGLAHVDPGAIVELGILLLIATPVARVVFAIVAFAIERDRLYVAVSIIVLAVLLGGLVFSR